MGKPCSMDLRERVVAAVKGGGMSCNRAAKQFGVAVSTAINWVAARTSSVVVAASRAGPLVRWRGYCTHEHGWPLARPSILADRSPARIPHYGKSLT